MYIEVENNVLKAWANYPFSDKAVQVSDSENRQFENGYRLENGQIIQIVAPKTYAEKRQEEYPLIPDQLDMIYWDKVNGTNIWQTTIAAIKAKYPKE